MPKPSIEFDALGTHWWIELIDALATGDITEKILQRVHQFQDDYSRFLPDSYIGQLNRLKVLKNPPDELRDMLAFAREMFEISGGVFNISVGGRLAALGYGKGLKESRIDSRFWDETSVTTSEVRIPGSIEVDLGGFGKGWLIDSLGALLESEGFTQFVINGGGDILVKSEKPVELALEHPYDQSLMIGTTRVKNGALGVSSNTKRVWKKEGKTHGHIIDPRTNQTSHSRVVASYIQSDTALIADTIATILLISPDLEPVL